MEKIEDYTHRHRTLAGMSLAFPLNANVRSGQGWMYSILFRWEGRWERAVLTFETYSPVQVSGRQVSLRVKGMILLWGPHDPPELCDFQGTDLKLFLLFFGVALSK